MIKMSWKNNIKCGLLCTEHYLLTLCGHIVSQGYGKPKNYLYMEKDQCPYPLEIISYQCQKNTMWYTYEPQPDFILISGLKLQFVLVLNPINVIPQALSR